MTSVGRLSDLTDMIAKRNNREPFITTTLYIGGPRDGGSAKVILSEPPPQSFWYDEDGNDVEPYCGFEPRTLLGNFSYYQIGDDGNYHWHLY